jgi:small-conductance mechanosensitive channel/CRP-like cAMP-binding protein
VDLWSTFAALLWAAWTPVLIIGYVLTHLLLRNQRARHERYQLRGALTLIIFHVIAVGARAAQIEYGYEDRIAELTAAMFQALAVVTLGTSALFRGLLPRVGLTTPRILLDLITVIGIVVAIILVGRKAGFSVAGVITTSAVLSAVIGLSLQSTLGNVMNGLSIQLDKSISVGDWISLGPNLATGQVIEIRWRYTALQTSRWDTVIVPNSQLVNGQITIIGRRIGQPRMSRRQVDFFVDFRTPPTEVLAAVEAGLRADPVPHMAKDPAPNALCIGVRDSYAHYCVRYWLTDLSADDPTDSAVRVRIWFALRRANIPMSIPASSMFLTMETREREERKVADEHARRVRALASVDLFRTIPDETRGGLANDLVFMPFARGESITREGATDDGLFMIVEGEAVVRIGSGVEEREVARLTAGQFFGEMSLMTGEARTATVVAATDMLCYRLDKPAFHRILRDTPAIADLVAEVLATRRSALSAVRDERDEIRRKRMETEKQNLLGRIRGFFGLDRAS